MSTRSIFRSCTTTAGTTLLFFRARTDSGFAAAAVDTPCCVSSISGFCILRGLQVDAFRPLVVFAL